MLRTSAKVRSLDEISDDLVDTLRVEKALCNLPESPCKTFLLSVCSNRLISFGAEHAKARIASNRPAANRHDVGRTIVNDETGFFLEILR